MHGVFSLVSTWLWLISSVISIRIGVVLVLVFACDFELVSDIGYIHSLYHIRSSSVLGLCTPDVFGSSFTKIDFVSVCIWSPFRSIVITLRYFSSKLNIMIIRCNISLRNPSYILKWYMKIKTIKFCAFMSNYNLRMNHKLW